MLVAGAVFVGVLAIGLTLMPGTNPSADAPMTKAVPSSLDRIADRNQDAAVIAAAQQRARSHASAEAADAAQARREAARIEVAR